MMTLNDLDFINFRVEMTANDWYIYIFCINNKGEGIAYFIQKIKMTKGSSLGQDLGLLLNNSTYSDIEILCGDEKKILLL